MAIDLATADLQTRQEIADRLPVKQSYGNFQQSSLLNFNLTANTEKYINFAGGSDHAGGSIDARNGTVELPYDNFLFQESGIVTFGATISLLAQGQHDVDLLIKRYVASTQQTINVYNYSTSHTMNGNYVCISGSGVGDIGENDYIYFGLKSPDNVTLQIKGYAWVTLNA